MQSIHSVLEGNFETDLYIFRIEKFLECTGGYFGVHLEFFWSSSGVLLELIWSSSGVLFFLEVSEVVLEISGVWTSVFSGSFWSFSGVFLECFWSSSGVFWSSSGFSGLRRCLQFGWFEVVSNH